MRKRTLKNAVNNTNEVIFDMIMSQPIINFNYYTIDQTVSGNNNNTLISSCLSEGEGTSKLEIIDMTAPQQIVNFNYYTINQTVIGNYNNTLIDSGLSQEGIHKLEIEHKDNIIKALEKRLNDKDEIINLFKQKLVP
ncbi:MAG: hypothetical protein H7Y13_02410 [Sphingobacteriaceae bacterium]|nr:hypothetical protein [Sphingobacteriaceae bacterium]